MIKIYNVNNQAFTNIEDAANFATKQIANSKVKPFIGFRGTELGLDDQVFLFTSFEAAGKFLETRRQAGVIFTEDNSVITEWDVLDAIWHPSTVAAQVNSRLLPDNPDLFNGSIYSAEQLKDVRENGKGWGESNCLYYARASEFHSISAERQDNFQAKYTLSELQKKLFKVRICFDVEADRIFNTVRWNVSNQISDKVFDAVTSLCKAQKRYIDYRSLRALTDQMGLIYPREFALYTQLFGETELVNWLAGKTLERLSVHAA